MAAAVGLRQSRITVSGPMCASQVASQRVTRSRCPLVAAAYQDPTLWALVVAWIIVESLIVWPWCRRLTERVQRERVSSTVPSHTQPGVSPSP